MIRRSPQCSLFCLLLATTGALAATPAELLLRSEEADKHVDYRGIKNVTLVLGEQTTVATVKVLHLKPNLTRSVYFSPAELAGTVVIRNGNREWKYRPREDAWEPTGPCPMPGGETVRRSILGSYDVRLVGTERVAGREAYVLQAVPKSHGAHTHRVWVDREYYLVLGTQIETDSGAVLRSSRYLSLQINPGDIDRRLFRVEGKIKPTARPAADPGFRVMKPSYLPKGYRLEATECLSINGCSCVHSRFTNGVNTVSIFQHKATSQTPSASVDCRVTNSLTWTRGGMRLTIMGDLPRPELQKIADSVR